MDFPQSNHYASFSDETLLSTYQNILAKDINKLYPYIMPPNAVLPSESTQFPITCFVESVRSILQIIMRILGKGKTLVIDCLVIGLFHLMMQPNVVLDIPTFWDHSINT